MIPDDLRQRLADQRAQALRAAGAAGLGTGYIEHAEPAASRRAADVVSLTNETPPEIFPGAVEISTPHGNHLAVRTGLAQWLAAGASGPQVPRLNLQGCPARPPRAAARQELIAWRQSAADQTLLLDLETCGFAGAPIFLIGLVHHDQTGWVIEQLLARHYGEERAVLATLWQRFAGKQALGTFNGKSFDWPMVRDRSVYHRLIAPPRSKRQNKNQGPADEPTSPAVHLDVLHHARRHWGAALSNCKLQTLERYVCGRTRRGDLLGREVPAAYHQFVRDGRSQSIRAVMHHNAWDLVTLWELAATLATAHDSPGIITLPPAAETVRSQVA